MNNKRDEFMWLKKFAVVAGTALLLAACSEGDNSSSGSAESASAAENAAPTAEAATPTDSAESTPTAPEVTAESVVDGVVFGEITIGDPNAPVEVIEYASLSCPHCAAFHIQTMPQIEKTFIDTGQVKFRFRNFVRDGADLTASMIARCNGPDRVYGLIDLFFRQQARWYNANYADELAALARRAGMNRAEFDRCLANKDLERNLIEIRNTGMEEFSINATPTFIVNGQKVEGDQPFDQFAALIRDNM